jgi:hypothetical protein
MPTAVGGSTSGQREQGFEHGLARTAIARERGGETDAERQVEQRAERRMRSVKRTTASSSAVSTCQFGAKTMNPNRS